MQIKSFAPASLANFIIGFDTLGLALSCVDEQWFGDIITIEERDQNLVKVVGQYAHKLPKNPNCNIITLCRNYFHEALRERQLPEKHFLLQLEKRLPIGSGLGSSAASIVATLLGLNTFYHHIFNEHEILLMAGQMEGLISGDVHYDNVAPSLLGNLQIMFHQKHIVSQQLPFFEHWYFVIYYPGISVSTKYARSVLPKALDFCSSVSYAQNLANFIHALHAKNELLALSLLNDDLIEPYRQKLVPHFEHIKSIALEAGAMAFGLSGSGPSCFAVANSLTDANRIKIAIETDASFQAEAFTKICTIDKTGAQIL